MSRARLDFAAGAPTLPEVAAALADLPDGNPSSPHAEGRAARSALDRARDLAAAALGVQGSEVVFTSSGTEAVGLALLGIRRRLAPGAEVVSWAGEHQAVLGCLRRLQLEGTSVTILGIDSGGRARLGDFPPAAGLVSASLANNEVGSVQPLGEITEAAEGALLHLDCCQGPQWLTPDLEAVDLASFSGHKLGAGAGGLLFVRDGVRLDPLFEGGPQQRGLRPGWEDVRTATAVAVALDVCARSRAGWAHRAGPLAARLREALVAAGGVLTGGPLLLANHASAVFPGLRGEDLLLALDMDGVAASSGSACASGSLDPSHVLLAIGFSLEDALGGLRLTVGPATTPAEVEQGCAALEMAVGRLRGARA